MERSPRILGVLAAVGALACCGLTADRAAAQDASVAAAGNPITGGLGFDPPDVMVTIGRAVEWTNTDFLVPHTATEDHGLWDLGGDYGLPPLIPSGFGPGESVKRTFEAGTHKYYCVLHADTMRGVVSVPVDVRMIGLRERVNGRNAVVRYVSATWAIEAPAQGQVFDVQVRRGEAEWQPFREATRQTGALFKAEAKGTVWHVHARLRKADDATAATDWSPVVTIVSDQSPLPKAKAKRKTKRKPARRRRP
jgi:plastocyanin